MTTQLRALPAGASGLLSVRAEPDLAALGYEEVEYVVSGVATAYVDAGHVGDAREGRSLLSEGERADFATRVVVRRPVSAPASGTLVAEWLNVSSGADAAPDWTFTNDELLRSGHAWAGVSAQYVGVEGGGGLIAIGDQPPAPGLRGNDPERYGDLHHPGDAFAYDIFTQTARAVRDLLDAERVLMAGESQSAFCLTTYANGVHPLVGVADGFLVHSRRATAAPLGVAGAGLALVADPASPPPPVRIRDDLDVPVLVVQTEGDLYDRISYLPARHRDSERVVVWEVAGSAHADHYVIGEFESFLGSPVPVNRGQQWAVLRAAVRHLDRWARGGHAPPAADPIETTADDCVRDEHGLARGGLRTPAVAVPTQVLSGRAWPGVSVGAGLFGSTTPLAGVQDLYPSVEAYLAAYADATDAAIEAGYVLAEDRDALLAEARPDLVDPPPNLSDATSAEVE